MVFLKDNDTFGYLCWPLSRIKAVYPEDDSIVTITNVLCQGRSLKQSIHHLIPIQLADDDTPSDAPPQYVHVQVRQ